MACLDSDILIAYLHNEHDAIKKLEDLYAKGDVTAFTTTINAVEIWKGIYRASGEKQKEEAAKVRWLLDSLELLTLDYESSRLAGELDAKMRANTIGDLDLLIASIALANGETLVTKNIKHFKRVPGLKVESW